MADLNDMVDRGALALLDTTDAQVWAREFCQRFSVVAHFGEPCVTDDEAEGLMLAWFANAIETGRSAGLRAPRQGQGPCVVTEL